MGKSQRVNELGILCKLAINLRFEHDKMFSADVVQNITDMTAKVTQGIFKLDMDDMVRRLGATNVFELGKAIGSANITPDIAWLNIVIEILTKYWRSVSSTDATTKVAITCKWEEVTNEVLGGYPGCRDHSCTIVTNVLENDFRAHDMSSPMWLDLIATDLAKIGGEDKFFLEVTKVVEKDK